MNSTANMKEGTDGQTCGRLKWTGTFVFWKLVINKKIYFTQLHLHVIQIDKEKETN